MSFNATIVSKAGKLYSSFHGWKILKQEAKLQKDLKKTNITVTSIEIVIPEKRNKYQIHQILKTPEHVLWEGRLVVGLNQIKYPNIGEQGSIAIVHYSWRKKDYVMLYSINEKTVNITFPPDKNGWLENKGHFENSDFVVFENQMHTFKYTFLKQKDFTPTKFHIDALDGPFNNLKATELNILLIVRYMLSLGYECKCTSINCTMIPCLEVIYKIGEIDVPKCYHLQEPHIVNQLSKKESSKTQNDQNIDVNDEIIFLTIIDDE